MTKIYKIFTDGGARGNPGPAASSFVVYLDDELFFSDSKFIGIATNNVAEYSAVLLAVSWLTQKKLRLEDKIYFYLDSELVTRQLKEEYKIKNEVLKKIFTRIKQLEKKLLPSVHYFSIPREVNKSADLLVNKKIDENL